MGNRMSSLWCKKSTLQIADKNTINNLNDNKTNNSNSNSNSNINNKSGIFRTHSSRYPSLSCISRDKKGDLPKKSNTTSDINISADKAPNEIVIININTPNTLLNNLTKEATVTPTTPTITTTPRTTTNTEKQAISTIEQEFEKIITNSNETALSHGRPITIQPTTRTKAFITTTPTPEIATTISTNIKTNPKVSTSQTSTESLKSASTKATTMKFNPNLPTTVKMSDFSDSSHSGVVSPATSLIENFHKKNGTTNSNSSVSPLGTTTTAVSSGCNGNGLHSASTMGRQINTSSSSSLKETSSQQVVNSSST
ncbi:cell wall protein DAN4-like, partial [Teleopsis dalmanni]|uniref:cell wall protein DAN4-like n=1 Tax=Teleopsis dalmanni TaxID=139649 RepID=UPI0018CE2DBD